MTFERIDRLMHFHPKGKKIHMVGIGGSGMSSLALHLKGRGACVSGWDQNQAPMLEALAGRGIEIVSKVRGADQLPDGLDLLVHTAAVAETDPLISSARKAGVEAVKYSILLGRLMAPYTSIAVAGTHGKTSVAALTTWLLKEAGLSPSHVIGGNAPGLGGGGGCGKGDFFVAEACEYDRSFLNLEPNWAIVTNLEPDHLDYFGDFDLLREAFDTFTAGVVAGGGRLVIGDRAAELLRPARHPGFKGWTFGFDRGADLVVSDLEHRAGCARFRLTLNEKDLGYFTCRGPGRHNVLNACAASLTVIKIGVPVSVIQEALPRFQGVHRRLEEKGTFGGIRLFSDFAHHPTEVQAVYDALKSVYPDSRLVVAYQGHQSWRTDYFFEDFGRVLAGFDLAMILKTYSVREHDVQDLPGGEALADKVTQCGGQALFVGDIEEAPAAMMPHLNEGDLLVLMGAGNIDELSGIVANELSRN